MLLLFLRIPNMNTLPALCLSPLFFFYLFIYFISFLISTLPLKWLLIATVIILLVLFLLTFIPPITLILLCHGTSYIHRFQRSGYGHLWESIILPTTLFSLLTSTSFPSSGTRSCLSCMLNFVSDSPFWGTQDNYPHNSERSVQTVIAIHLWSSLCSRFTHWSIFIVAPYCICRCPHKRAPFSSLLT